MFKSLFLLGGVASLGNGEVASGVTSPWLRRRIATYCNHPDSLVGGTEEGIPPEHLHEPRLVHSHVIIRHGDRSAIHSSTEERPTWTCGRPTIDDLHTAIASPLPSSLACLTRSHSKMCRYPRDPPSPGDHSGGPSERHLSSLRVDGDGEDAGIFVEHPHTISPLVKTSISIWGQIRSDSETCEGRGGDLTSRGFTQLETIGGRMGGGKTYRDLAGEDLSGVAIHTTDTGRTALSATAFVKGFIQGAGAPPPLAPIPMHIIPRNQDPIMAAAHWNLSTSCPWADEWERVHKEWLEVEHGSIPSDIVERLGIQKIVRGVRTMTTEEMADDIFTRLCHDHPLPCWPPTPGDTPSLCMREDEAEAIIRAADAYYHRRYGSTTSDILMTPLLSQVLVHMKEAMGVVGGGRDVKPPVPSSPQQARLEYIKRHHHHHGRLLDRILGGDDVPSPPLRVKVHSDDHLGPPPRIIVRAAHDTAIAPLLSALGHKDREYGWPNYASRVVFELWMDGDGRENGVRILYNGIDITRQTACVGVDDICTLSGLEHIITTLLHPHPTFFDACTVLDAPPPTAP